jgi:Txe/YoeB family toxin of Txe-Axe toxin-antitoxin module
MEEWFRAYGTWPPINQMIFSIIVVAVCLLLLFLAGIWLLQVSTNVAVWLRGWPDDKNTKSSADYEEIRTLLQKVLEQVCTRKGPLTSLGGTNWREEARRIEEEHRLIQQEAEKDLATQEQALLQQQMELEAARREAQRMGEAKPHNSNGSRPPVPPARPSAKPGVEPLEGR